jgi:hypothetical protein
MLDVGGLSSRRSEDCCIETNITGLSLLTGTSDLADYLSLSRSNENMQSPFPHCSRG